MTYNSNEYSYFSNSYLYFSLNLHYCVNIIAMNIYESVCTERDFKIEG